MRCTVGLLQDDVSTTSAAGGAPIRADVGLPHVHWPDLSLIGDGGHNCRWSSCAIFSTKFWPHEARDVPSSSRDRLLRASFDRVNCYPAPTLARGLPNDPPGEVDAGVGGDDIGAGLEVGAQPNPVQRALGQRVLLPLSVFVFGGCKRTLSPNSHMGSLHAYPLTF